MRARIPRSVVTVPPRVRDGMSPKHEEDIRCLHCIGCGAPPRSDVHHLLRGLPVGERGTGRKASSQWAIPLCRTCHDAVHEHGNDDEYLAERGMDGRGLAKTLWSERGDREAMERTVFRHLSQHLGLRRFGR